MRFSLVLATLAISTVAYSQAFAPQDGPFQIGYAANLNIGDSVVNLSNDGFNGGVFGAGTTGNICVNTYVFDPQEEEIGCCACLVTPNGLNSLSVKSDLISNNLTPAVPTSVVIKLLASTPTRSTGGALTVCNPAIVATAGAARRYYRANRLRDARLGDHPRTKFHRWELRRCFGSFSQWEPGCPRRWPSTGRF